MLEESSEVPEMLWSELVECLLLAEHVKPSVVKSLWCKYVRVEARLLLMACPAYQLRKWVVQNCLCRNEWKVRQSVSEVARQS